MWAGGRLQWRADNPLVVGDSAQRVSRIQSVKHKTGRTGDLLFVQVMHEIGNARGLSLTEEHDIVYRAAAQPDDPVPQPVAAEMWLELPLVISPDSVWMRATM